MRAAFKAVQDSKQVAVLVPTTLLVQQHFETFTERFEGFPVNVAAMSRFQTTKEINETIKGLEDGSVDVVIGTHKLLNPKSSSRIWDSSSSTRNSVSASSTRRRSRRCAPMWTC